MTATAEALVVHAVNANRFTSIGRREPGEGRTGGANR
jgi:hypothetical protein